MRCGLVHVERPVEDVDVFAEPTLELDEEFRGDLQQRFRIDVFVHRPDLDDGFLRRSLFAFQKIVGISVSFGVTGFAISLILRFTEIEIPIHIERLFHQIKSSTHAFFFLIGLRTEESLIAVPIHVLADANGIDVFTVFHIEVSVVVLRIINAVLSGSAVVACEFHFAFSFPTGLDPASQSRRTGQFFRRVIPSMM